MSEIDGEEGLAYQLYVLRRMSQQLPDRLAKAFVDQLDKVIDAINIRNTIVLDMVKNDLDDVRLSILYQQFDLDSTKQEKADLERKLREAGL